MKPLHSIFVVLLSLSSFSFATVTTGSGIYLGEGKYVTSYGPTGTYSSLVRRVENIWTISYLRSGEMANYLAILDFKDDADNFFDALIVRTDDSGAQSLVTANGYCIDSVCHFSADISIGIVEETMVFSEDGDKIQRFGGLTFTDSDGGHHTMAWKENLRLIADNPLMYFPQSHRP